MARNLIDKVRRLQQIDVTWLCTARRAPVWITPKDQPPYRPYVVLVMEQGTELIRRTALEDELPTPDVVLESLLKAMTGPLLGPIGSMIGFGKRGRPARILLDDADLVAALAPRLAEMGVRCNYSPSSRALDVALREMQVHLTKRESIPGLLSVPGVTEPLAREIFETAAEYYRQSPWRWIDNASPIEIRYPPDGRSRYAIVMGSGGETFGISLYESQKDLDVALYSADPERVVEQISWFSLIFEGAMTMPFGDLDAMGKYGWPVAGERAYPLVVKAIPPDEWWSPSASEIAWLAAALRVIPDFVVDCLQADRGRPRPAEATYSLPGVHGGQSITLRYPVSLLDAEMQELEEYIEDWHVDEQSHEFARQAGALLFQFMDYLETTGLSEQTVRKHESNCWAIGYLECQYGYHDTFSLDIFSGEPSYLYEFGLKFSDSKYAVASYKATWRKLARYVRSLEQDPKGFQNL
ncbi:MAG: hypothetical protein KKC18_12555 [Chloroflexi bacterium]|nr:hypothetical protein [Chloroflexota bacterium]